MAVNPTRVDTIRLEARLTLMAEMLQRAAEEARLLVEEYTSTMRRRDGEEHTFTEDNSGDTNVG